MWLFVTKFFAVENLRAPQASVKTLCCTEQMTTDTTSERIKDYHHKNDRIKDVRVGFEPPSGDVAGWVGEGC